MFGHNLKKVAIVDEQEVFRYGLKQILNEDGKYKVVHDSVDVRQILDYWQELSPDIIVCDAECPPTFHLRIIKALKRKSSSVGIIILFNKIEEDLIQNFFEEGAHSCLLRTTSENEILRAIDKASQGEKYFASAISNSLINTIIRKRNSTSESTSNTLSYREIQIIKLLVEQMTNKEIAGKLHLSIRTIEDYIKGIKAKTGSLNAAGIIVWSIKNKIITI